jgi:hypothetical protein
VLKIINCFVWKIDIISCKVLCNDTVKCRSTNSVVPGIFPLNPSGHCRLQSQL